MKCMRYTLGADLGSTSVGWAVLDHDRNKIEALGVRLFPGAENPKDGSSLAEARRLARGARRSTRRKQRRMKDIRKLLVSSGVLTQDAMDIVSKTVGEHTPWEYRVEGLDRLLKPDEWTRVLIHMAKRRGFKSNRKEAPEGVQKVDKNDDEGKMKAGVAENSLILKTGNNGKGYRTVAEMFVMDPKFGEHKRNKDGQYINTVLRAEIEAEAQELFKRQRSLGNPFAGEDLEKTYLEIFNRQLPFASGDIIEKMVGHCTMEPEELRAPKASWTAERFILLSNIRNMRVVVDGSTGELGPEKSAKLLQYCYDHTKVTYKQIRNLLDPAPKKSKKKGQPEEQQPQQASNWHFAYIPAEKKKISRKKAAEKEAENPQAESTQEYDPEEATFAELKAFHEFRKAVTKALGEKYWTDLTANNPRVMDDLAFALTFRKNEEDIRSCMAERNVPEELIEAVIGLNFKGTVNLSLKAMTKLIPFMEEGSDFTEACGQAGYSSFDPRSGSNRSILLPVPDQGRVRNPVVFRAITQTRKVINEIIRKYGSPERVQIELAKELAKPIEVRKAIKERNDENYRQKQVLRDEFENRFSHRPSDSQLEKYRLWKEQDGYCPYTGEKISLDRLFSVKGGTYADIDHIVPYSRSFDNSWTNKVLVMTHANRDKKDMTPYEYFGQDSEQWNTFLKNVEKYIPDKSKARRLMTKDRDFDEIKLRCLNDTRSITKYVADWIESSLVFSDPEIRNPVVRINGQATATIRKQWGIESCKRRDESDLHHALDACVVAAATPAIIDRISKYSAADELGELREEDPTDSRKRLPEPWKDFAREVRARISEDPAGLIKSYGITSYTEEELQELRPIFVSRMPDRKAHGEVHEATVRSLRYADEGKGTVVKVPLKKIKLNRLENMVGKDRDKILYEALRKRLKEHADKPLKAFAEPFYKPSKDGTPGRIVKSISLFDASVCGLKIREGMSGNGNGSMVHVNIYRKDGKHYIVPYYIEDIARKRTRMHAIVAGKPESEWLEIDNTYEYMFSLFMNDIVKIVDKSGKEVFGYYKGCDRSNGGIKIVRHDSEKDSTRIGVKTAAVIEKYDVNILGEYHKVKHEKSPCGQISRKPGKKKASAAA